MYNNVFEVGGGGGGGVELCMSIAPQDAICAPMVQVTADISKGDVSVNLG